MKITRLSDALGAEVSGIDFSQKLSSEEITELISAWHTHLVLRFRGRHLSDQQLLMLTQYFGTIDPPGPNAQGKPYLADYPDINVISNIKVNDHAIGGLGDGEASWHTDMTYIENPPKGSFLHALEIPSAGGNTSWGNMYLAYEDLSADIKNLIANKKAIHDATYNSAGIIRKGMKDVVDVREAPGAHHPLVISHPSTNKPVLFLGRRRNSYILGLGLKESNELLDELWAHAGNSRYSFTQEWQLHDLILWDNIATIHRRDSFDPNARRLMHRTQIKGNALRSHS